MIEFKIQSTKHGEQTGFIDDEDYGLIYAKGLTLHTTPRHGTFYVIVYTNGVQLRLHRLILNPEPGAVIDHINGNGLDNRRSNLRVVSQGINNLNARKRAESSSKYKGVTWYKRGNKWRAQIQFNKKKMGLGYYSLESEAAHAYNLKAKELFGELAVLNVIE